MSSQTDQNAQNHSPKISVHPIKAHSLLKQNNDFTFYIMKLLVSFVMITLTRGKMAKLINYTIHNNFLKWIINLRQIKIIIWTFIL